LMTQLVCLEPVANIEEAHMRNQSIWECLDSLKGKKSM
jgi:hypothetical protein